VRDEHSVTMRLELAERLPVTHEELVEQAAPAAVHKGALKPSVRRRSDAVPR
jgi:hypothetical protein